MLTPGIRNIVAAITLSTTIVATGSAASEPTKTLGDEQREVDQLLGKVDHIELRRVSPQVFQLAERLLKERGDAEARPYFEKGLEGNPWALEQQLTLGEILSRAGQSSALPEKAEMVWRLGEEEDVLQRSSRLIGRPLPEEPKPLSEDDEAEGVLILVPVGKVSIFTLHDLRDMLSKRLGIKVVLAALNVEILEADRTEKTKWVEAARDMILKTIKEQPEEAARLRRLGFTASDIRNSDDSLVDLMRKATGMEQGAEAVRALDLGLARLESMKQWDSIKMIGKLHSALQGHVGPKRLVLGITTYDLFGETSDYLFGTAYTDNFLGIISAHRCRAVFNDESPRRERLNERMLKQSLSTIGFMIGVPRCTTPECARAYPESLAEHDQKPSTLCPTCRAGFEKVFEQKLPEE